MLCRSRKLAQMAAYFLSRANGGPMEHVKLMKLMYMADREAINRFGFSISEDEYWSMKLGPVLSQTLDLMSGYIDGKAQDEWDEWISAKEGHCVSLQEEKKKSDLDEFARAEIAVMDDVFNEFGNCSRWDLINYTHDNYKEWADPGDGRLPITLWDILEALGKPEGEIAAIVRKRERENRLRFAPLPSPPPFVEKTAPDVVHA
jgi:uncharacterized phage-associated protein